MTFSNNIKAQYILSNQPWHRLCPSVILLIATLILHHENIKLRLTTLSFVDKSQQNFDKDLSMLKMRQLFALAI